jgi:hypothetical protein
MIWRVLVSVCVCPLPLFSSLVLSYFRHVRLFGLGLDSFLSFGLSLVRVLLSGVFGVEGGFCL